MDLYRYVGGANAHILPVPMMNIINGGMHADNPIDFQEFMVVPFGAESLKEAVRMGSEIFHTLKKRLKDAGHNTNVGDEGGFAPNLKSAEDALAFVVESIEKAGFTPGKDVGIALDCAATEFFKGGKYVYEGVGITRSSEEQAKYLAKLAADFPIISIEDGMSEDDWDGWKMLTELRWQEDTACWRRLVRDQYQAPSAGHRQGHCQFNPRQGQPDWHIDRDAECSRNSAQGGLHCCHVASFRRNRGFNDCRPRRCHKLRTDQDGFSGPL